MIVTEMMIIVLEFRQGFQDGKIGKANFEGSLRNGDGLQPLRKKYEEK